MADVTFTFSGDATSLQNALNEIKGEIGKTKESVQGLAGQFAASFAAIGAAIAAVKGAFATLGGISSAAAAMEQTGLAFKVMMGDAAAADCSWDDSVYSYIDMSGASFLFNDNAGITLSVGGEALQLFENAHSVTDTIELVLMQNVGNASTLNLALLADITQLVVTSESAGYSDSSFSAGSSLTDYYKSMDYKIDGNNVVLSVRLVPEPTTATLSLLALAGLAVRRR